MIQYLMHIIKYNNREYTQLFDKRKKWFCQKIYNFADYYNYLASLFW